MKEEVIKQFGFDPETIGLRHRSWWIVEEPDEDEEVNEIKKGYLCVNARDGAENDEDESAYGYPNFVMTMEDSFDGTYRYYYYKPL